MAVNSDVTDHGISILSEHSLMPRVPPKFRERIENKVCYDPLVVSIGPYHHGKTGLESMEKFKDRLESNNDKVEMYRKGVEELVSDARRRYTNGSTDRFKDEEFIRMLVRDGLFIIHFLFCNPEELRMTSEEAASVTRDLLLLENQIPFKVLFSLMRLRFENENQLKGKFEDFFNHVRSMPSRGREWISNFFGIGFPSEVILSNFDGHLLGLFHLHFVGNEGGVSQTRWYQGCRSWKQYYPVKELNKVGILLKPSNTGLFTDILFRQYLLTGELHVPPLSIDDFTKPLVLNLVAYEDCLGFASPHLFTSYVCFMRSLIDSPEDVEKLRLKGVLLTNIESHDDQVVQLFKEMATNLVDNPGAFIKVKNAINSQFRSTFWQCILRYKGPVSKAVVKYSFLYGFVVSAIQAYVAATQQKPVFGNCSCPKATQLHH